MTEQQIAQLETENQRLARMVDSLLTHNEQLREENAYLKTHIGTTIVGYSNVKTDNGTNDAGYSIVKTDIGIHNGSTSNVKNDTGTNDVGYSIVKTDIGTTDVSPSNVKTDIGITNKVLPVTIEITYTNAFKLKGPLKRNGFLRVSWKSVQISGQIMLHCYNKQLCSYAVLRKVTGMSEGGIAKRLMSMRKVGLITRTGFQRFELTEKGKRLIMEVFGVDG